MEASITFDRETETLSVQRCRATADPRIVLPEERAPHTLFTTVDEADGHARVQELLSLRIFYDVGVLEVFANERTALTTRVYPETGRVAAVEPLVDGSDGSDVLQSLKLWELPR